MSVPRKLCLALLCLSLAVSFASPVSAVVLVNNPLNGSAGFGWNSNSGTQQIAETFVLSPSSGTPSQIVWHGFNQSGTANVAAFDLQFFADVAGLPSITPFFTHTTSVLTGTNSGQTNTSGNTIYTWSDTVAAPLLASGTTYWFGVRATTSSPVWTWSHSNSDGSGDVVYRPSDTASWTATGFGTRDLQAFQIDGTTGAIPEPTTLAIWSALGGLGLIAARRRRKAA